ncbi:MAG TPA: hypothetical protein VJV78_03820 [Polyangiales bacterium]|nr:hypothetical protein [Polyangiales bacterium]
MKLATVSRLHLLVVVAALGYGCAAEVDAGAAGPVEVQSAALGGDSCEDGFLGECRDGNKKMCAKYSERCEVRIGVIGDSLSDEYQGAVSALPGLTWTEQVQADSRISMGAQELNPSVRGEPRNNGFALNWARFGQAAISPQWSALTNDTRVPVNLRTDPRLQTIGSFDAQINGLAAQIAAGQVDVALVWVGHNDLFIRSYIGYDGDGGQQAFFGALITKIITAAATLRAAASADPGDIKAKVAIIGLAGAASALNPSLSAAAANAGITYIDPFNTAVNAIVNEQATTGKYDVDGVALHPFTLQFTPSFSATPKAASLADLSPPPGTGPCGFNPATNSIGCSTPAYADPFQHYDAIHPNTLYMGVVGNQIVTDVNTAFGFAMRTISEAQLADTAGL